MGNGRENPSFSSTLLDSIYRSIDESNGSKRNEDLSFFYRDTTMRKKQNNHNNNNNNKVLVTRQSRVEFDDPMLLNSSSTNSDSSSGGGFSISSSESDSLYSTKSWPKPIRTGTTPKYEEVNDSFHASTQKTKQQSKALKIYSELKKVKQPISPGAKLAGFINSLFNSANAKNKKKKNSSMSTKYEEKTSSSACSSASSFSRSCFSMTSRSSRNNAGGGTKRSVRFCLDDEEDSRSRPCGQIKILHENELQPPMMRKPIKVEEDRRVAEAAKEILNSYWKKKVDAAAATADDDDDDVASYASSDLFELDNLKAIGNERYLEELPVYETTHFDTNRAIAKGLIL